MTKINNFRGGLNDISAKTATLPAAPAVAKRPTGAPAHRRAAHSLILFNDIVHDNSHV